MTRDTFIVKSVMSHIEIVYKVFFYFSNNLHYYRHLGIFKLNVKFIRHITHNFYKLQLQLLNITNK